MKFLSGIAKKKNKPICVIMMGQGRAGRLGVMMMDGWEQLPTYVTYSYFTRCRQKQQAGAQPPGPGVEEMDVMDMT